MPVEGFDVGPIRKWIYRLLDQLSGHFVERFIVVSNSLKKTLIEERRIPHRRVVRIYKGIEVEQYHPDFKENASRNQWGIPPAAPLIGAIGRMVWQKGFKYLILAVPEILEVVPEVKSANCLPKQFKHSVYSAKMLLTSVIIDFILEHF